LLLAPLIAVVLLFISGVSQGAVSPLIYELAAELLYPVSEGLSGGILVLILNGACFATIFLKDYLDANVMNFAMSCFIFVVTSIVFFGVKETYRRPLG
jgi:fucose permease